MRDIALIDYGAGNLTSVRKGFAAAGAELFTPATPSDLSDVSAVVVPGVGHFGATAALEGVWHRAIASAVARGVPTLGICLGLQWLFQASDEAPDVRGLGVVTGRCTRLPPGQKVPHVGWNSLALTRSSSLLAGIQDGTQVYFTHSYAAPVTPECVAITTHGIPFAAAIEKSNVFGVQFHPEKSGTAGITILSNFAEIAKACSRNAS
jgi:glutamine amidotransferase